MACLSRSSLHDYQLEAIRFATNTPKCALWLGLGAGKTASSLTYARDMLDALEVEKVLIVGPLKVSNTVWHVEVSKWAHLTGTTYSICTGSKQDRLNALARDAELYIINRENIPWLVEHYGKKWPFDCVIIDEASSFKNNSSQRWKAFKKVSPLINRMVQLTGTPAPNGLLDLWSQMYLLDGGAALGRNMTAYKNRWFESDFMGYSYTLRPGAEEQIYKAIGHLVYRCEEQKHSERIDMERYVTLPPKLYNQYKDLEKEFLIELQDQTVTAVSAAALSNKLLQFVNGNIYNEDGETINIHKHKIDVLKEIREETDEPLLVAYNYKSDLKDLMKAFPEAEALGKTEEQVERWNNKEISMLFVHPACLHPTTEVLTEFRGWIKIVDVRDDERVFDGVEFVNHRGCHFSGVKPVIEKFGISLTENHKLLIDGKWVEAKDVRDCRDIRRKASYTYKGDDDYLSEMLSLRGNKQSIATERRAQQQTASKALRHLHKRNVPQYDEYSFLEHMERYEESRVKPSRSRLQKALRVSWHRCLSGLAKFRKFLSGHVGKLSGRSNFGQGGQRQGVQQAKLSMGHEFATAVQQKEQQKSNVRRGGNSSCGVLQTGQSQQGSNNSPIKRRDDWGRSVSGLQELPLQKGAEKTYSEVYDLVDCGPRSRFLIRNDNGEVFISHNSAGHGLNLQRGSSVLVWYGLTWSLELYLQLVGRLDRQGQTKTVKNIRIVCSDTIEERVIMRLLDKNETQTNLLEYIEKG